MVNKQIKQKQSTVMLFVWGKEMRY